MITKKFQKVKRYSLLEVTKIKEKCVRSETAKKLHSDDAAQSSGFSELIACKWN